MNQNEVQFALLDLDKNKHTVETSTWHISHFHLISQDAEMGILMSILEIILKDCCPCT